MIPDPAIYEISLLFLTFFTALNQSYIMTAFNLLAGYFTPGSYEKKGATGILRDGFIRLEIPLFNSQWVEGIGWGMVVKTK